MPLKLDVAALYSYILKGVLTVVWLLLLPIKPAAQVIPNDATFHIFVKPANQKLHLLLRLPLRVMGDFDIPTVDPGFLDLPRIEPALRNIVRSGVLSQITIYEDNLPLSAPRILAARTSLPSDRSFRAYDRAVTHVLGPGLNPETLLYWQQSLLDVLIEYDIHSDNANFSLDANFAGLALNVITNLKYLPQSGTTRSFEYEGYPGLVRLDPHWHQAAWYFIQFGFTHVFSTLNHWLFLICLVLPFSRVRPMILVTAAFALSHSITLFAAAYEVTPTGLWFPSFLQTAIAISIIYAAFENIIGANLAFRWPAAFAFGLVYGFGFNSVITPTLQFAGSYSSLSYLAFNFGLELGFLAALGSLILVLITIRKLPINERLGIIIASALIAHTGWHWMREHSAELIQYQFALPSLNVRSLEGLIKWLMLSLITSAAYWVMYRLVRNVEHSEYRSP